MWVRRDQGGHAEFHAQPIRLQFLRLLSDSSALSQYLGEPSGRPYYFLYLCTGYDSYVSERVQTTTILLRAFPFIDLQYILSLLGTWV